MSSPRCPSKSTYQQFSYAPNTHDDGYSPDELMTMPCQDGTILYETWDRRLLMEIIRRDDVTSLEQYLAIDPQAAGNESEESFEYYSPYYAAVDNGSLGALRVLLPHQETITIEPGFVSYKKLGFTLLNEAARRADIEMVQFLLDNQPAYADINERDVNGCTAILSAADIYSTLYDEPFNLQPSAQKGETVMNMLLDRGASASDVVVPFRDDMGTPETVLTLVARWAGPEIIKKLINGGADVHAKITRDPFCLTMDFGMGPIANMTAISMASFHANVAAIQTFIDCRGSGVEIADIISFRDSSGSNPLHWLTRNYMAQEQPYIRSRAQQEEKIKDIIDTAGLLLDIDPHAINNQDCTENTPLHYATQHTAQQYENYTAVIELLCKNGADASIRNDMDETPLHTLISHHRISLRAMSILLAHGARVTDTDKEGNSPLHLAVTARSNVDVISFLLEQGADANLMNMEHNTPLHVAALHSLWVRNPNDKTNKYQEHVRAILEEAAGKTGIDMLNGGGKTAQQERKELMELRRKEEIEREASRERRAQQMRNRSG
ncbi:unnamed protein product [Fusarium graminearum]|uniref:Uncharacterized protein n=1 Tax=Gibberella zeae TaxID=5518 RepID=A0A9N8NFN1_GIBZA|nr:unnamed protein product [Fusarium graminearum]CAG1971546.1 unnamed protein product [Fusarium graminearum]CAG1988148.1 unnamed protein product [Fusarium graminearum]